MVPFGTTVLASRARESRDSLRPEVKNEGTITVNKWMECSMLVDHNAIKENVIDEYECFSEKPLHLEYSITIIII